MSFFIDHPRARWILPVAAVGVIGATALTVNQSANADSGLPPRTASQLLADVRAADVSSLSGTVVQTSDLGLPEIPGLGGSVGGGSSSSSLTSLISGTHTWRVWLDGPTRQRLALIGSNGESDVIRNGKDVWLWSSADKSAVHHTLTSDQVRAGGAAGHLPGGLAGSTPTGTPSGMPGGTATGMPGPLPSGAPRTPDEAAAAALALMGQDTAVTTSGAASVAGRSAYELVLTPKDKTTLVGSVRIAIDSEVHVPLRVQVYSTKRTNPAFEVGFTAVDFAKPDARQFAFTPPAGTKVTESDKLGASGGASASPTAPTSPTKPALPSSGQGAPKVVGTGWSTVVVAPFSLPTAPKPSNGSSGSSGTSGSLPDSAAQLNGILKALPTTSGTWGSGHVLEGTLFSVVLTTDGRVAVGAVPPAQLYSALAAK